MGRRSTVRVVGLVETRYVVTGWGVGNLWTLRGVLVAHDFHFGEEARAEELRASGVDRDLVERFRVFLGGGDVSFDDVRLDLEWATPLQRSLADVCRAVPRGDVVSYGELAALAGRPRAPRAAGAFCAANRFSFVVPCHRVVAANGIGGYGDAGVEVKRRLLALEGVVL